MGGQWATGRTAASNAAPLRQRGSFPSQSFNFAVRMFSNVGFERRDAYLENISQSVTFTHVPCSKANIKARIEGIENQKCKRASMCSHHTVPCTENTGSTHCPQQTTCPSMLDLVPNLSLRQSTDNRCTSSEPCILPGTTRLVWTQPNRTRYREAASGHVYRNREPATVLLPCP